MLVRYAGSSGLGPLVLMCSVRGSTFVTASMEVSRPFMPDDGCSALAKENMTSSASKALPLWNFTPGRSLISHTVGSLVTFQDSARVGSSLPSRWRRISGS